MRILIYGLNFSPELIGVGKYTGEFAEWLASRDHEVLVVTTPPYYPHWKVQEGYSSFRYTKEVHKNIQVHRCPLWVPRKQSALRRILHLLSFALSSLPVIIWKAFRFRPLLVIVIAPTILCAPGGIIAARLVKAKSWLHFQDLEIDAAFGISLLHGGFIREVVRKCERWILRAFNRVSSISKKMMEHIITKGCDPDRTLVFPNWVDTMSVYPIEQKEKIRADFNFQKDSFIVLYSGNIGAKQGLDYVVEAARLLTGYPAIHFVIAGDGTYRETLKSLAAGMENVTFLPLQPTERFNEFLNTADVHIISQLSGIADAVMPSKLLGILAVGGVVVASVQRGTGLASLIEEVGGIPTPPGSPQSIADALVSLYKNPARGKRMMELAREYALQHFEKTKILESMEQQIRTFTTGNIIDGKVSS
ncbi:MAG: WcaI family glycosyltransferase [Bacteroidota bacterium]